MSSTDDSGKHSHNYDNLIKSAELSVFVRMICDQCLKGVDGDSCDIMNCAFAKRYSGENLSPRESTENVYEPAKNELEKLFLEENVKQRWRKSLEEIKSARNNIAKKTDSLHPFPPKECIEDYLGKYYGLLTEFLDEKEYLESFTKQGSLFVEGFLSVDLQFENIQEEQEVQVEQKAQVGQEAPKECKENVGYASLYAPTNLDALLHLYHYLDEYRELVKECQAKSERGSEFLLSNCREVIISKMLRDFRWMVVHDGELWQVALPAALSEKWEKERPTGKAFQVQHIPIRRLSDYSSYEGINEIRLFDKIVYEMEKRANQKDQADQTVRENSLSIYLVGDINKSSMIFLCRLVEQAVRVGKYHIPIEQFSKIHYKIFTNTECRMSEEKPVADVPVPEESHLYDTSAVNVGSVSYYQFMGRKEQFTVQQEFNKFMDGGDLIFILDDVGIYQNITVIPVDDVKNVQENIRSAKARLERIGSPGWDEKEYLVSRYHNLREMFTGYLYHGMGRIGMFHKKLNEKLMKNIANRVEETDGEKVKSVYTYVSDLDAMDETDYSAWSVIRTERYNEKQFRILQLTNRRDSNHIQEANNKGRKLLAFNIWQVVKAAALYNVEELGEYFSDDLCTAILHMRNTFVGIDYSDWKKGLIFYLDGPSDGDLPESADGVPDSGTDGFPKVELSNVAQEAYKDYADLVSNWLKCAIIPFFKGDQGGFFADYYVKSFATFLYSDAKSISDMLFVYLFGHKHSQMAGGELSGARIKLKDFVAVNCKYSYKHFYLDTMCDYDTSTSEFLYKYKKMWVMSYMKEKLEKEVFQNIAEACRDNFYDDSFLYSNMLRML